jgi:hypothetical protein
MAGPSNARMHNQMQFQFSFLTCLHISSEACMDVFSVQNQQLSGDYLSNVLCSIFILQVCAFVYVYLLDSLNYSEF